MKIERLRIAAFGRLRDLDTGQDPLSSLVVVLGPNEAGKSTLFHFLTTILYGFYPATREKNPYAPWDGGDPAGSASIRLDGGGCVEVVRRLRSQPTGQMTGPGRDDDLRNRSLPWVEHVPLKVFQQVFAVSLAELVGLEEQTWEQVQDRLIGTMGAADLRPARVVAEELDAEAGRLWRITRHGNQEIRRLRAEEHVLTERRRTALEGDRRLRETVRERDEAEVRLRAAREDRQRRRLALERLESLVPVRTQLRRVAELRVEAGDPGALDGLPPDPAVTLESLDARATALSSKADEIEREREEPQRAIDAFDVASRDLLERREEIMAFVARATRAAPERARADGIVQEIRDLDRRLAATADGLLAVTWEDVPSGPLHALPMGELRARIRQLHRAREDRRVAEAVQPGPSRPPAAPAPAVPVPARSVAFVALVGVALLVVGIVEGWTVLAVIGGATAAVGVTILAFTRKLRAAAAAAASMAPNHPSDALDVARRAEDEARAGVIALLRDVPVAPDALDHPDDAVATGLERLQELVRDRRERERALDALRTSVGTVDRDAHSLAAVLGRDVALDAESLAHLLENELRRAERLAEAAAAADREMERLERTAAALERDRAALSDERDHLSRRLAALGDGDARRGADEVARRRRAAARADELEQEMERTHPDLDGLRRRIEQAEVAGETWTVSDEEVVRLRADIEVLENEVEDLIQLAERLSHEVGQLEKQETVDAVDGALDALRAEEARLEEIRDRKWLLGRLIREADRRFREQHQPDVMKRAGDHLRHLTGGRYDRILADESEGAGSFHVSGPGVDGPTPLTAPLSRGTLEQAYLALRLAIVDHLDQGHERLPLFLDEVLVNWDGRRRGRGVETLVALSETRQVFLFTCHPAMAEALADRGARVVEVNGAR